MNLTLKVSDYIEYATTALAWRIQNAIWDTLLNTGIIFIPLTFVIIHTFLKAREQGDDEGNKGKLWITWFEQQIAIILLIIFFVCAPIFTLNITKIDFNSDGLKQCSRSTVKLEDSPQYKETQTLLGGTSIKIPLWFAVVHILSKGITYAAVDAMPCGPDLRQIRTEIVNSKIKNPVVLDEVKQFVADCYMNARRIIFDNKVPLSDYQAKEIGWIGAKQLVDSTGLYDSLNASKPVKGFPLDSNVKQTNPEYGGYPSCQNWWKDESIGLRKKIIDSYDKNLWDKFLGLITIGNQEARANEDRLIKNLVSVDNINVSGGAAYSTLSDNPSGGAWNNIKNLYTGVVGTIGAGLGLLANAPGADMAKEVLPMVQAFALLSIIVCSPLIIMLSGFRVQTVVTMSIMIFAIIFLTFWWELARYIDDTFFKMLYSSDTHSRFNIDGFLNFRNDFGMNYVMWALFYVFPSFWMGALTWAGINAGRAFNSFGQQTSGEIKSDVTNSAGKQGVQKINPASGGGKGSGKGSGKGKEEAAEAVEENPELFL